MEHVMKLGPDVLLEIMNIVQNGLVNQTDVSQELRDLELVERDGDILILRPKPQE